MRLQEAAGAPPQAIYPTPPRISRPAKPKARKKKSAPAPPSEQQQAVQLTDDAGQPPQQLSSPRKAQRKRAPKRKHAGVNQPDQAQLADSGGALSQLLNLPINERALEHLLAGEWQVAAPPAT